MSEIETSEVRDPEIPAMVFGRPPTRPASRGDDGPDDGGELAPGEVARDGGEDPDGRGDDVGDGGEVPGERESDDVRDGDHYRALFDRVVSL